MTRLNQATVEEVWRNLEEAKVFEVGDLAIALKCSIPNARLKIKQWRAYTSYNKNGRFYALPHVPKFDQYGLWWHKESAFSQHGNLTKTVIHLVRSAPAGISGKQLGGLLGLSPQSFLHHFRNCPGIYREKYTGVYIYFADDASVYEKQVRQRCSIFHQPDSVTITDQEAIMILVAIIKDHEISVEEILELPEVKRTKLRKSAIQGYLEHHGLVKKNLDLRL